ncbi:MAG: hypothetical protein M3179_04110 [Actinomycetota bacterium]|nr:hypothetical protein [Actinomycetota bacterium]
MARDRTTEEVADTEADTDTDNGPPLRLFDDAEFAVPQSPTEDDPSSVKRLLDDRPYLVLGAVLLVLMISFTLKVRWGSGLDIWEHAAAARELGAHPLDPQHPLFALDRPHQFLSPYHLTLGLISRVTGLSIVTVLSWAGVFNLGLFLVALWLFVTRLLKRRETAFWALLFSVFLWGVGAWYFSGFVHFKVLPFVLSYPSTFAKALALLGLWVHLKFLETEDPKPLLPVVLIGIVVLLAHPVDALFMWIGMAALSFGVARKRTTRNLIFSAGAALASFLVAFLWPYFSLFDLLFGPANESFRLAIAGADQDMYVDVLGRLWPALIVVPFFLRRLWLNWRDPLSLFLAGLLAAYLFGWRTEEWSYGRLISAVVVVGAILLADERTRAVDGAMAAGGAGRPTLRWVQLSTLALLAVGVFNLRNGFIVLPQVVLDDVPYNWVHSDVDLARLADYSFLSGIPEDDVVMSDVYTSLELPTFGPKAVAVARAEAFVDTAQPGADQSRFFTAGTTEDERRAILDHYDVSWLLLRNERLTMEAEAYQPLLELGPVVHQNDRFTLLDVRGTMSGRSASSGRENRLTRKRQPRH